MDGPGDGKIFARAPGVQDQSVNAQGFPPGGVFQVAYSVRMRSGSSPSWTGVGMMALLSKPIRWKALQKAPESREKKVWSPLKGTGVQVYHFMMP